MSVNVNGQLWNIPTINNEAKGDWTGAELKHMWGIPHGNKLYRETLLKKDFDKLINDNDVERLRDGSVYYDLPLGYCS